MTRFAFVALFLCGTSCGATPHAERLYLIQDIEDGLTIVEPQLTGTGDQWLDAIRGLIVAVRTFEDFEWEVAFDAIAATEPLAISALEKSGRTADEAAALIAVTRIALRRLRAALIPPTTLAEPGGAA